MNLYRILTNSILLLAVLVIRAQDVPIPSPAQLNWQNAELAAVFHYDLHVFDGKKYRQPENRITPIADHNIFNPNKLDTDQWILAAKAAGFKIAMLTATHETGFANYQSEVNPYSLKTVRWKEGEGDLVRDFVNSCRKHGLLPGIYIGIRWNSFYGIHDFKVQGDTEFSKRRQAHYNRMCEGMVKELCTQYGDLAIIWFDGGAHGPEQGGPDVLPIVEKHQPNTLFYHNLQRADMRWGGSESGTVPYPCWGTYAHPSWMETRGADNSFLPIKHGDPEGKYYMPAMSDAPLRGYNGRHEWFWEPGDDKHVYPLENLVDMYYQSVGRNSTLILGLTPDANGLLPETDVKRLQEFGDEIKRRFSSPVGEVSGEGKKLVIKLDKIQTINQIVISEDIEQGERVRAFSLEAKTRDGWKTLFSGSCIGHKFIHQFDNIEAFAVRLLTTDSRGKPVIKSFQVFKI